MKRLIETAGRLVANKNAQGSGVTAPCGTIDDAGRVRLSRSVMTREGVSDTMPPMGSSKIPERRIRKMPEKKVSRVIDVQKNNQLRYNFTGVPETDPRACFNRATWNPAVNLEQPPLGTSHLILGDSLVRVLSNLRTSWVTTVMAFGGATIAQLYRMVELMNPGRIPNVIILVGTNNISKGLDEEEALWESMMVCLLTILWQKFNDKAKIRKPKIMIVANSENDEVHRAMVEPLLEASGKRNWRSNMLTHDEFPCHCLLQTWWYPERSILLLIWDSGELLSMGLPDSSRPITIVIVGVMIAIR